MDLRKTKSSTQLKTRNMGVTKSYNVKLKSQLRISKTQASLLPKLKPTVRLNFNPKRNFGKATSIKLFKVVGVVILEKTHVCLTGG